MSFSVLCGRQADGWLEIEDTKEAGYLIAPGFSGGPVWDDVLDDEKLVPYDQVYKLADQTIQTAKANHTLLTT